MHGTIDMKFYIWYPYFQYRIQEKEPLDAILKDISTPNLYNLLFI